MIMKNLESVGWKKFENNVQMERRDSSVMNDLDIKGVFDLVDVDKSGCISRRVGWTFLQCLTYF